MDLFQSKNIHPMLIEESCEPFDDQNFIYEIKWDGIRCIIYLDPDQHEVQIRNKKNTEYLSCFPELESLWTHVSQKCILDGELITLIHGKPDFHCVQARTLMQQPLKINLASRNTPATFIAFDMLYYQNQNINNLPLLERKEYLFNSFQDTNHLVKSWYTSAGITLYKEVEKQGLEGIVAKKKNSIYRFGKRSNDWIKSKVMQDDDFAIIGYISTKRAMSTLLLAKWNGHHFIQMEKVSLGVRLKDLLPFFTVQSEPSSLTDNLGGNVVWIEPISCTVLYMPVPSGELRQLTFKTLRLDKYPEDCT